jgi:hypothetical protein
LIGFHGVDSAHEGAVCEKCQSRPVK